VTRPQNQHGGDWASFEIEYGRPPLDFSMNVNPLGMSEKVRKAIAEAAKTAEKYPDPACRQLRNALAEAEGVSADRIFCGAGAADIIYRLAKSAKTCEDPYLLITAPTFAEYEEAFAAEGWKIGRWPLEEKNGFKIGEDMIDAISDEVDMVFLCEPNNPTGVATDKGLLEKILEACHRAGAMLVIDECFNGFLDNPEQHTMKGCLNQYGNLIILKAFTKLYGMAGVRLGYCLCPSAGMVESLAKAGPPWNVSSLAQAAGLAALEDSDYAEAGRKIVQEERPLLKDALRQLGIAEVFGEANYLLFKGPVGLDEKMRERGILIRNCDNYYGLGRGWYRIAVKTHEDNLKLLEEMKQTGEMNR